MLLNIFAFNFALTTLTSLALGTYVYLKNPKSLLNKDWFLLNTAIGLWAFGFGLGIVAKNDNLGLWSWRFSQTVGSFMGTLYFKFVCDFIGISREKRHILRFGYLLNIFIFIVGPTKYYIPSAPPKLIFRHYPEAGLFYPIFTFIIIFYFSYAIYLSFINLPTLNAKKQIQLRYFLAGTILAWLLGSTGFLLSYNIPIMPWGCNFVFVYTLVISYVILKHQLMDISIVIRKGLVYSLLAASVTAVFFTILLVTEKFFQGLVGYQSLIVTAIVGFIITLGFNPLKNWLQRFIDRRFFKGTMEEISFQNERLMQQIQQADKLKAVATLAAGMAHEIKNPLTAVKTFSQYLPNKYNDSDFINRYGQIVPQEIERINKIVADVLLFSKPKEPNFKEVNINNLLSDTLDFLSNDFLNKNIKVVKEFSLNHSVISADPDQMKQVFLNLFLNALDAMSYNGALTVKTSLLANADTRESNADKRRLSDATISDHLRVIRDNSRSSFLEICISDTGCGIREENLKHIFEPFHTTKSNGTGLGLAVVNNIIRDHKAQIKVESEVGKGTKFIVRFPAIGQKSGA